MFTKQWALWLCICLLSAGLVMANQDGKKEKEVTKEEKIQKLVDHLGHKNFKVREKATEELKKMGKEALPYLQKALKSKDPEVQWRAKSIMESIKGFGGSEKSPSRPDSKEKERNLKKDSQRRRTLPRRRPPIRFKFGIITPNGKKKLREFGFGPQEFQKQLELLEKLFNAPFEDMEKYFNKRLEEPFKQLERLFGKNLKRFRVQPRFEFKPNGKGGMKGRLRMFGFKNGKKYERVWKYKNGRWVPQKGKESERDNRSPRFRSSSKGPKLGVVVKPLEPSVRKYHKIGNKGMIIFEVKKGTRAEKAGLKAHDVILEVNGKAISDINDLRGMIYKTGKGPLSIEILRSGKKMTIEVPAVGKEKSKEKSKKKKTKKKFF